MDSRLFNFRLDCPAYFIGLIIQTKQCSKCNEIKLLDLFLKDRNICKLCRKIYDANNRLLTLDRKNEVYKLWKSKNLDKCKKLNEKWRKNNREYIKEYYIKNKDKKYMKVRERIYGITKDQYDQLLLETNGQCIICQKLTEKFVVDHCHLTGKVRGLICGKCNSGLGFFNDSIQCLNNAIKYLKKHKSE